MCLGQLCCRSGLVRGEDGLVCVSDEDDEDLRIGASSKLSSQLSVSMVAKREDVVVVIGCREGSCRV
jgi:hypothetical protein